MSQFTDFRRGRAVSVWGGNQATGREPPSKGSFRRTDRGVVSPVTRGGRVVPGQVSSAPPATSSAARRRREPASPVQRTPPHVRSRFAHHATAALHVDHLTAVPRLEADPTEWCSNLTRGPSGTVLLTRFGSLRESAESFVARRSGSERNPSASARTPSVSLRNREFDRHQKTCETPGKQAKTKAAGRAFSRPSLLTAVSRSFVADQSAPREGFEPSTRRLTVLASVVRCSGETEPPDEPATGQFDQSIRPRVHDTRRSRWGSHGVKRARFATGLVSAFATGHLLASAPKVPGFMPNSSAPLDQDHGLALELDDVVTRPGPCRPSTESTRHTGR